MSCNWYTGKQAILSNRQYFSSNVLLNSLSLTPVSLSHPFLFKADQSFIIIALQLLRCLADQSVELCAGRTRLQQVEDVLQGGLSITRGWHLLLLQVVTLLLGKVDKHLGRKTRRVIPFIPCCLGEGLQRVLHVDSRCPEWSDWQSSPRGPAPPPPAPSYWRPEPERSAQTSAGIGPWCGDAPANMTINTSNSWMRESDISLRLLLNFTLLIKMWRSWS